MGRGGHRPGAGRKPGQKGSKKIPKPDAKGKEIIDLAKADSKTLLSKLGHMLTAKGKKQYEALVVNYDTPVECLRALRDDMVTRYLLARKEEIDGRDAKKKIAKIQLKELNEHGTVDGKKIKKADVDKLNLTLERETLKEAWINPAVTALSTELRQINELIDRIESQRTDLTVNIFNVLQGGRQKDTSKLEKLTNAIFTLPEEGIAKDNDIIDVEIVNEDDYIEEPKEEDNG